MHTAVVGKGPKRVEFELELRATVENAGVPHSGRIARHTGSGAVETGVPYPLYRVARFNGNRAGRKFIAPRPDVDVPGLGLGDFAKEQGDRASQAKGSSGSE